MTIEQIVEIPADHRISFDIPRDIPAGKAVAALTIIPVAERAGGERQRTESMEYRTPSQKPPVSLMDLYGSCAGEDTLDAYFKRKQADKALEDNQDINRFQEPEP
ncbi:MAG: hypothetical protein LBK13_04245 [Spirochaetales bacterium]|jgi:hypothetical protein|nr:hypothetical protein [Spirochaetales bacterium]